MHSWLVAVAAEEEAEAAEKQVAAEDNGAHLSSSYSGRFIMSECAKLCRSSGMAS